MASQASFQTVIKSNIYLSQSFRKKQTNWMGCESSQNISDIGCREQPYPRTSKTLCYLPKQVKFALDDDSYKKTGSSLPENVEELKSQFSGEEVLLVQRAISNHFLFFSLSEEERVKLIRNMKRYQANKGTFILKRGYEGELFFVLVSGNVEIHTNDHTKKILGKGESFGELSLIYSSPRSSSVLATSECILWGLNSAKFKSFLEQITEREFNLLRAYLERLPLFGFLSEKEKDRLILNSNRFKFLKGSTIFRKNDISNSVFIIISGRVEVKFSNKPKIQFEEKDIFGEGCLMGDQFRFGTASCLDDTECMAISKDSLLKQLGNQSENIMFFCICKWALKDCATLKLERKANIDKIIKSGKIRLFEDGEVIQKEGHPREMLYICLEGQINGQGTGSIFNGDPSESGGRTLVKKGKGFVFECSYATIKKILKKPLSKMVETQNRPLKTVKKKYENSIKNYVYVQKWQESDLGGLLIVKDIQNLRNKKVLQYYRRDLLANYKKEAYIANYLNCLKDLNHHPLISKVENIMSDQKYLFSIRDYVGPITLLDILQDHNLEESYCRFYVACIIQILEHLHRQNVIHRNMRPEAFNILEDGYLAAYDLSSIKTLDSGSKGRTFTIVGSPHYLAPEATQARGYSYSADVWSLGIITYEMCFGLVPFGAQLEDPIQIFQQVTKKPIVFPHHYRNTSGMNLILSMLKQSQSERESLAGLKKMPYFQKLDFEKFAQRKYNAPELKLSCTDIHPQSHAYYQESVISYLQKESASRDKDSLYF